MKTNHRLLLTAVLFAGLIARPVLGDTKPDTNIPPLLPPPTLTEVAPATAVTPATTAAPVEMGVPEVKPAAPAKKVVPAKKKSSKPAAKTTKAKPAKKAAPKYTELSQPLKPGAAVVTAKRVNVRGKATTRSEIITRLTNGEPVTVIEEIVKENHKADEPNAWAKIALPAGTHGWVFGQFVDATTKTVTAKKLNVRSGAGENYSILGQLHKGDTITTLNEKAGWFEVEAPSSAIAYVAAAYLKQEVAPVAPEPAPEPAPTPTTVADGQVVAPAPTDTPDLPPSPAPTPETDIARTASPAQPAPDLPMILDPSIKREVDREGVVRRTWSIQAPSDFRLVSVANGESIVYLHTASTNLDLSRYKGLHIIATGEEGMDRRWKKTPVLTIRRIQVIE